MPDRVAVNPALRIVKAEAKQRYTLGVVYVPRQVDSQGDYAEAPEIEQACWDFMRSLQGRDLAAQLGVQLVQAIARAAADGVEVRLDVTAAGEWLAKGAGLGVMHREFGDAGDIVECYLAPADLELGGEAIPRGTWLLGVVWSEAAFARVAAGELTGLSMGGTGRRVAVDGVDG